MDDDTPREDALEIIQRMLVEARRRGKPPEWIVELTERRAARLAVEEDRVAAAAKKLVKLIDELAHASVIGKAAEARAEVARLWIDARSKVIALKRSAEPRSIEILRDILQALPTAQNKALKDTVNAIREIVRTKTTNYGLAGDQGNGGGRPAPAAAAVGVAQAHAAVGLSGTHG